MDFQDLKISDLLEFSKMLANDENERKKYLNMALTAMKLFSLKLDIIKTKAEQQIKDKQERNFHAVRNQVDPIFNQDDDTWVKEYFKDVDERNLIYK